MGLRQKPGVKLRFKGNVNATKLIHFHVNTEMLESIVMFAQQNEISTSEAVRRLVDKGLEGVKT